jgi:hypothetical protein
MAGKTLIFDVNIFFKPTTFLKGTVRYEKRTKTCEQTWDPEEGRSGKEKPSSWSLSSSSLRLLRGLHSLVHHQHWLSVVLNKTAWYQRGGFPFLG